MFSYLWSLDATTLGVGTFALICAAGYVAFKWGDIVNAAARAVGRQDIDRNEALKDVIQGWKPTGYIDFSVPSELRADYKRRAEHAVIPLMMEEHRIIKSIGGGMIVERRTRRASVADANEVASNYHQFLQEHPEKAFNEDPRKSLGKSFIPGQDSLEPAKSITYSAPPAPEAP